METVTPGSPPDLAEALASAASNEKAIRLGGHFTKDRMAGPLAPAAVTISTNALSRLLDYEPRDLTISVEAGMPVQELNRLLAANKQMVPLDPPHLDRATVGGVIAANACGPRRRLYGTARDLIIGMTFATLEGKLIQSGGMVVKNVAGLDMAKLLIGSFGTLAAIATVNFKLNPIPEVQRTFLMRFESLSSAISKRDSILQSVVQPSAIDIVNPSAAMRIGLESGYCLVIEAGGNAAVISRYTKYFAGAEVFEGTAQHHLWENIREFTPRFLTSVPEGVIVRVSSTLAQVEGLLETVNYPAVCRAGSGVTYVHFEDWQSTQSWINGRAGDRGSSSAWRFVVESAPQEIRETNVLWAVNGSAFEMMEKIKHMFDPTHLVNRGRLYGRI